MLRVLAGVDHDVLAAGWQSEEVAEFFGKLDTHMDVPVRGDSPWVTDVPGEIFSEGASGPKARRQDLRALTAAIVGWAITAPAWLVAHPA